MAIFGHERSANFDASRPLQQPLHRSRCHFGASKAKPQPLQERSKLQATAHRPKCAGLAPVILRTSTQPDVAGIWPSTGALDPLRPIIPFLSVCSTWL